MIMSNKAAFLDRDGTLVPENPFSPELLPGVAQGVRLLNDANYLIVVVTNQSAVGRGEKSRDEYNRENEWLDDLLVIGKTEPVDAFYACFHDRRTSCQCRKPKPGLIHAAARDLYIDVSKSIFIGNTIQDMVAAESGGVANRYLVHPLPGYSVVRNKSFQVEMNKITRSLCKMYLSFDEAVEQALKDTENDTEI